MEILFLQRPEVLIRQRDMVAASLASLDNACVRMASNSKDALLHTGAEVLLGPTLPWLAEVVEGLPRLEWIHFLSAGVDPIWEMPFDKTRYRLSKSSGVHADTISEYILAAILYSLKGFGTFQRQQVRREWTRHRLEECAGKTLAIIGLGAIGRRLAERASALDIRVIGTASAAREIPYVEKVFGSEDLEAVVGEADFVTVTVPLTAVTRGIMGARAFAAMKDTAWFINVARGEVVDEPALIAALRSGRIAGAVLDVFTEEPLPEGSPLWDFDNVLITPHVAGTSQHYMTRALDIFKENYRQYIRRGILVTPVSVERGY